MSRSLFFAAVAAAGLLLSAGAARADHPALKSTAKGDPQVQSVECLTFGPQGLLLIGDGKGQQIVAVDTGDTKGSPWTSGSVKNLKEELANRIGTNAAGIEIVRLAVNPASRKAYIAVRKKSDKQDVILTVDGGGKIDDVDLSNVTYARVPLTNDAKVTTVTDVTWADDRVLAAVQANDTFGSKIVSIPAPIADGDKSALFDTETYHVAHAKWETKAPIRTVMPYEADGVKYAVGAFTCTPIVKYPLEEIKPQARAKVKGTSVIELGNGNTPQDMFAYEKGGKKYILVSTHRKFHSRAPVGPSPYWTAKVDYDLLTETEQVNEKAIRRVKGDPTISLTERAVVAPDYHGVSHMDKLDANRALVIRTDEKGNCELQALQLP